MKPLPPGSIIGILGGGQLGRMLAVAAAELGYHAHIFCPEEDCPASDVARHCTFAEYTNPEALRQFARSVDVATFEFENIPAAPVEALAAQVSVHPSPEVLRVCQHRIREKEFVQSLGIHTAPFVAVRSAEELEQAVNAIGLPAILKTTEMGYDGKGQITMREAADIRKAWEALHASEAILEGFVAFEREISVIVSRTALGNAGIFVPVENIHRNHILHQTIAPAPISSTLRQQAERIALRIAEGLQLVGTLAVEMFITDDQNILVNELAPRPHNSGHWTIDACITSQFEQTVRAVCGLPLGNAAPLCPATMTNLIGDEVNSWPEIVAQPDAKLHLYGKKEARQGRKMGHYTVLHPLREAAV